MLNDGPLVDDDFIGIAQIPNNKDEQFSKSLSELIVGDDKEQYLSLTPNLKKQLFEKVFKKLNEIVKNEFTKDDLQCPIATGIVAVVDPGSGECVIAHAGNSEVIAVSLDQAEKAKSLHVLNKRHILSDKAEKDRLSEKGAEFHLGALGGMVYISRGFGGSQFSEMGFNADPEVIFYKPEIEDAEKICLVISSVTLLHGRIDEGSVRNVVEVNHCHGLEQIACEMANLGNIKFGKKSFAPNEPMTVQVVKISDNDKERPLRLFGLFTGIQNEVIAHFLRENFMDVFKKELYRCKMIKEHEAPKPVTFAYDTFETPSPDNRSDQELEIDIGDFEMIDENQPSTSHVLSR